VNADVAYLIGAAVPHCSAQLSIARQRSEISGWGRLRLGWATHITVPRGVGEGALQSLGGWGQGSGAITVWRGGKAVLPFFHSRPHALLEVMGEET
jgi:hypothetical protein